MKYSLKITIILGMLLLGFVTSTLAKFTNQSNHNQATIKNLPLIETPNDIKWVKGPDAFPTGAQYAVLEGNVKSKGPYTIRIKLPADYQLPAHTHPSQQQRITILSGTLNLGTGDKLDITHGTVLPTGSFVVVPPKNYHYAWTTDETVLQINGMGPWNIKYVNASEDPRKELKIPSVSVPANTMPRTADDTESAPPMQQSVPSGGSNYNE